MAAPRRFQPVADAVHRSQVGIRDRETGTWWTSEGDPDASYAAGVPFWSLSRAVEIADELNELDDRGLPVDTVLDPDD